MTALNADSEPKLVGILLAAGFSRRFGPRNKLMHPLKNGEPLALHSARTLIEAIPLCVAAVRLGHVALGEALQALGFTIVWCDETALGMADSLSRCIRSIQAFDVVPQGVVIALADMPFIRAETLRAVAHRTQDPQAIVVPTYHGQRGHPVGFGAAYFPALEALSGDEGARSVLRQHAEAVRYCETEDAGIVQDIDTPEDLPH